MKLPEPTIIVDMDWCENQVYDAGDMRNMYEQGKAEQAAKLSRLEQNFEEACENVRQDVAKRAEVYYNSATLQKEYTIYEYLSDKNKA